MSNPLDNGINVTPESAGGFKSAVEMIGPGIHGIDVAGIHLRRPKFNVMPPDDASDTVVPTIDFPFRLRSINADGTQLVVSTGEWDRNGIQVSTGEDSAGCGYKTYDVSAVYGDDDTSPGAVFALVLMLTSSGQQATQGADALALRRYLWDSCPAFSLESGAVVVGWCKWNDDSSSLVLLSPQRIRQNIVDSVPSGEWTPTVSVLIGSLIASVPSGTWERNGVATTLSSDYVVLASGTNYLYVRRVEVSTPDPSINGAPDCDLMLSLSSSVVPLRNDYKLIAVIDVESVIGCPDHAVRIINTHVGRIVDFWAFGDSHVTSSDQFTIECSPRTDKAKNSLQLYDSDSAVVGGAADDVDTAKDALVILNVDGGIRQVKYRDPSSLPYNGPPTGEPWPTPPAPSDVPKAHSDLTDVANETVDDDHHGKRSKASAMPTVGGHPYLHANGDETRNAMSSGARIGDAASPSKPSMNPAGRLLYDSNGDYSVDWGMKQLLFRSGMTVYTPLEWSQRYLNGDWKAQTGDFEVVDGGKVFKHEGHSGKSHPRKVSFVDVETGEAVEGYLRGGIICVD